MNRGAICLQSLTRLILWRYFCVCVSDSRGFMGSPGNFGRVRTADRFHRLSEMVCGADPTTPPTLIVWVAQVAVLRELCICVSNDKGLGVPRPVAPIDPHN